MLYFIVILVIILATPGFSQAEDGAAIKPVTLRVEYHENPVGIDNRNPALSWLLVSVEPADRNQVQTAYEILVASSLENLNDNMGDLWDSGPVYSNQNTLIKYRGTPLRSLLKCYWKVRIRDGEGELSHWSEVGEWTMGLLDGSDWKGDWIGAKGTLDTQPRQDENGYYSQFSLDQNEEKWILLDLGESQVIDRVVLHPALPLKYPNGQTAVRSPGFGFPVRFKIDISDSKEFEDYKTVTDLTQDDFENPGYQEQTFFIQPVKTQYVRLTVTKLWNFKGADPPFGFGLGELQVFYGERNLSLGKKAYAKDSEEEWGWSMKNLTDGRNIIGEIESGHEAILFRKETKIARKLKAATVCISGLGYYELYINGKRVGDRVLSPGFTDYSKRVLYNTYDAKEYLKTGANVFGVIVGGGWYNIATPDAWGFHKAPWTAPPKLLFNLHLEYTDGDSQTVVSDTTWKWSTGPIVFNCVRGGEFSDARQDKPGWDLSGYDDKLWQDAVRVPSPEGKMVSEQNPPIRVNQYVTPVNLTEPIPGVYVYDMGVNMSGWARFEAEGGERGDTITFFYNERLAEDGTVRVGPHTWWHYGPYQTGKLILSGSKEVFEPRFTYHGFRYVQVTGLRNRPRLDQLQGAWVYTDVEKAGEFSCSNPDINQIQEMVLRTQLSNLHSIPTDCPHREKIGWLGDGVVTFDEAMYNFDMATFYTKWYRDILDAQEDNGHVPPIAPNPGWIQATSLKNSNNGVPAFSDPWWGGACIILPWKVYQYYGDRRLMEEGYLAMQDYLDWLGSTARDHILTANLGDWIEPAAFNDEEGAPKDQVGTAAYYYFTKLMEEMAELLNNPTDKKRYSDLAASIKRRYNEKFFDPAKGSYSDHSQLSHVFPLALGLVPEGKEELVERQLIDLIKNKDRNHLNTGFVGTPFLFNLLVDRGYSDLAYTMVTQEDHPGWIYMLRNNATTVWEVWDAVAQNDHSRNHPAFGSISAWFYRSLAGIQPDSSGPGFKRIIIRPALMDGLTWASSSYHSINGKIVCNWRRDNDKYILEVAIPPNTTALVYLPSKSLNTIYEGNKSVSTKPEIKFLARDKNRFIFEVGSGRYHFESDF